MMGTIEKKRGDDRSSMGDAGAGKRKVKFHSSIYGQSVFLIAGLSVILFLSFGMIFRSVCESNMNNVIRQSGNNVGSLIEGALFQSMLENDQKTIRNTLDIINTMTGIEDVNLYNENNELVYSSFSGSTHGHIDPDCKKCHLDFATMFPAAERSYRIIDSESDCQMAGSEEGDRHLLIRTPIMNQPSCYTAACHAHREDETVLGSLIIKMPMREIDQVVEKSVFRFYILAIATTIILLVVMIFFTSKAIKAPLNNLVKVSAAVAGGDRSSRVEVRPGQPDDMRIVSEAFNDMLDKLDTATRELENWSHQLEYKVRKKSEELSAVQNEIIHVERLASLGKLSSSVAHEINNPLSGILVYAKLIQKQLANPELTDERRTAMLQHLKMIESETRRCGDIVKGLLEFSKKELENFEVRSLHEILDETFELMSHPVKIAGVDFRREFNATADRVRCSPNQVKQACVALIMNATEAIKENGEIVIRTENTDNESITFEISDNGIGISEDDQKHIFEPFFSTKQGASGIGLGLPIVHGIVQSHEGTIRVRSAPEEGTTVIITLKLSRD